MNRFVEKIQEIRPLIVSYCKSCIHDKHAAEDIAQDTMVILVKKQDEYDPQKSFPGWAFAICKFQIKAYLSRISRSPELVEFCKDSHSLRLNSSQEDPRHLLSDKEKSRESAKKIRHVYSVIGERPGKFLKFYLQGKSRSFIMKKLNMSQVSYYSTKLRLIRKARVAMKCKP